ncbi:hypothetical protein V8E55_005772 [Tylopilus felleus]
MPVSLDEWLPQAALHVSKKKNLDEDILAFTNHHQSLIHSQRRGFANAARQLGTTISSAFKEPIYLQNCQVALPNSSFVLGAANMLPLFWRAIWNSIHFCGCPCADFLRRTPNRLNEFPGFSDKAINQCYPFNLNFKSSAITPPNVMWMLPMFTEVGEGGGAMGKQALIDCNSQADFLHATHASLLPRKRCGRLRTVPAMLHV